jgi:hypothetical protein
MGSIYLLYRNILENSTVTVTNEDTSYPKWRLHDRDIGKLFKGTSNADHTIHAEQTVVFPYAADTLIIPSGHNLSGVGLDWEYSPNDADWSDMVTAWIPSAAQIEKEAAASQTKRYWKLILSGLAALPQIPELWIGQAIELQDVISWGYQDGVKGNVERIESLSGRPYMLKRGEERQYRNYSCKLYDGADRTALEAFFTHSREKPFYLKDLNGIWCFMSLVDPNTGPFGRPSLNRFDITLEMIEVLA